MTKLVFGAPETYTDGTDTEGDKGKTFHLDEPHEEVLIDRNTVWQEPWNQDWFLPTKMTPRLDDRLRFPPPSQTRDRSASGPDFSEDYFGGGEDYSPPPVQPSERHLKKRKIEPNYIEDFEHRPEDARPKRNPTPYGGSKLVFFKTADIWYNTFWVPVPEDWNGEELTPEDQRFNTKYVLLWDDESILQVIGVPDDYRVEKVVIPPEQKTIINRINPNVYTVPVLSSSWIVDSRGSMFS